MSFQPYFSEIRKGKNTLFLVHYSEHSIIKLFMVYNEISNTYMGVTIDGFVENIRGLLYAYPNFLEVVGLDPAKELAELGFKRTEPNAIELLLYAE